MLFLATLDLSAPRVRFWLVRRVNNLLHHLTSMSVVMFNPKNLFRDPRVLQVLSNKQPDHTAPK